MPKLRYTGHPFIDVGVATITAFSGKLHPEEVTEEDLERVAEFIKKEYVKPPLKDSLRPVFTNNSWFFQPSNNPDKEGLPPEEKTKREVRRAEAAEKHLYQWQAEAPVSNSDYCVFFEGESAVAVALADKLPPGRAGSAQLPFMTGNSIINFVPYGALGLPISGIALLSLQCFPLGCVKCGFGFLAVHSDDEWLTYQVAHTFWEENIRAITQGQLVSKYSFPRTLLINILAEVEEMRQGIDEQAAASVTAYNFFSDGQHQRLELFHLPMEIVGFVRLAQNQNYKEAWNHLVQRAWQVVDSKKEEGVQSDLASSLHSRRNYLYEDLFDLPDNAARFIRTYFLRIPQRTRFADDPRSDYSPRNELALVSWSLVELFLRKVVQMDKERIADIRALGDKLALFVRRKGGKPFFHSFYTENNATYFRWLLIKANMDHIKDGQSALFDMDTYIDIFEEGYEVARPDWKLARDLVLMRMIDQLKDWLALNPEAIPEIEAEREPVAATTQQN